MRVKWLRNALLNIEDEAAYLEKENAVAASQFVARIFGAAQQLSKFPAMGRPGRVAGTRELIVPGTKYIIPYRVRNDAVEILRVFHTSRKWPYRF
ncbi:MAG TPA: type II toxin-antitoxin system RelE/ParE family toxin [Candidatus Acidoferrum sp.]|nr:type II toxin-antitoxin system RelE/ParE family toxin [Candidatus Acidoferrum sp.]